MNSNKGNVLIVVLVFFMMTTAAIGITATDIAIGARTVKTDEALSDARVGLIYLMAYLKHENSGGMLQSGITDYHEYRYDYTVIDLESSDLSEITVDIDHGSSSFSVRIILDKMTNTVELYEILE